MTTYNKLLITGTLQPSDGRPGCTFAIYELDNDFDDIFGILEPYHIEIRSPYLDQKILAQTEYAEDQIARFLLDHRDY